MFHLYDYGHSGNGYKIRLALTQLDIPFRYTEVDIIQGESHTAEFKAMNPNGKIPVLITEHGPLAESHAILTYVTDGSHLFPNDPWTRANIMQWLCFEQYSHEPYIATSRFWMSIADDPKEHADKLAERRSGGLKALAIMESHLKEREFFVADTYTIADIALYAYTHVSHEGGFLLDDYPAIRAWLERVESRPKYITIHDLNFPR